MSGGREDRALKVCLNEIRLLNRETMLKDNKKRLNNEFIAALVVDSHP